MSITWTLDTFAGAEVVGQPTPFESPVGRAASFDGQGDALIFPSNPHEGAEAFTIEALFCPARGGPAEQRFVHVSDESRDARALLETRLTPAGWYADTFLKDGPAELFLNEPTLLHSYDQWHTLALVYDGREMRQFVNGRLELSGQITCAPFGAGRVSVGCRINRLFWFKGAIRTVRFTRDVLGGGDLLLPGLD